MKECEREEDVKEKERGRKLRKQMERGESVKIIKDEFNE